MTDLIEAYRARHDGYTPGGRALAQDVNALPDDAYLDAYQKAYTAKHGTKPPETSATPSKPEGDSTLAGDVANGAGRLAGAAVEGVARSVWELGRTTREVADFVVGTWGGDVPDFGPMPDMIEGKTGAESFVSGAAQFLGPFMAFSKALAGAKVFDAVGRGAVGASLLRGATASAPVDFAFIDPIENNLMQVAKDLGLDAELKNYLGASTVEALLPNVEADALTTLENRAKAAMVNLPVGMFAETGVTAIAKGFALSAKMLKNVGRYAGELGPGPMQNQRGMVHFHGSPHTFDKFDINAIGTGEGAQVYGHGLYFAQNKDVAGGYAERLANSNIAPSSLVLIEGQPISEVLKDSPALVRAKVTTFLRDSGGDVSLARKNFETFASRSTGATEKGQEALAEVRAVLSSLNSKKIDVLDKPSGNTYEVDIPDDVIEGMLRWDASLSEQTPAIRKAVAPLRRWAGLPKDATGQQVYEGVARMIVNNSDGKIDSAQAWKMAAKALEAAGVPGIKYKDAASRSGAGGTDNVVLFNDKHVKMLKRNDESVAPKPEPGADVSAILEKMQALEQQLAAALNKGDGLDGVQFDVAERDETGRAKSFKIRRA